MSQTPPSSFQIAPVYLAPSFSRRRFPLCQFTVPRLVSEPSRVAPFKFITPPGSIVSEEPWPKVPPNQSKVPPAPTTTWPPKVTLWPLNTAPFWTVSIPLTEPPLSVRLPLTVLVPVRLKPDKSRFWMAPPANAGSIVSVATPTWILPAPPKVGHGPTVKAPVRSTSAPASARKLPLSRPPSLNRMVPLRASTVPVS